MGETLAEHIKRLRSQRAQKRLQFSDKPITEIALDLGYESPSAFTKVFNQVLGQSPRQYRKAMQPLLHAILKRTNPCPSQKSFLKPEYVQRSQETILFVRRIGDYNDTPVLAFEALVHFLERQGINHEKVKAYYCLALDIPEIVGRSKCRFDACASLTNTISPQGEVGQKILRGGRFAVFLHRGHYSMLEQAFDDIFQYWYPTSGEQLADAIPFCEHISAWDKTIPDDERLTKLYFPLESKS